MDASGRGRSVIRVALADDHLVVRAGLRALLASATDVAVIAESSTVEQTVAVVRQHRPDVLILDITLGGQSSLTALAAIRAASPETRTLILTMHDDPAFVRAAFTGGVLGYLLKDAAAVELVDAVRQIARGVAYLQPTLDLSRSAECADQLTEREEAVLAMLAGGYTNTEIAQRMYLSLRTIEGVRASLRDKLGVERRADFVAAARRAGIVR